MLMKQNLDQVNDDKALIVTKKQTSKGLPPGFVVAVGRTNEYASDTGGIIQRKDEVRNFYDEGQMTNQAVRFANLSR